MRWRSWVSILVAEFLSAALTIIIGLLTNVLTNEKHPERRVIVTLVIFGVSSAAFQVARYVILERKSHSSDQMLSEIHNTTQSILVNQQDFGAATAEKSIDDAIQRFPEILHSRIKLEWQSDRDGVDRVLEALNDPATRPSDVVGEWQRQIPVWLKNLSWHALLVAGELANAYDGAVLSAELFIAAINSGATRREYWSARAALLWKFQENESRARQVLQDGNVDLQSPDHLARIVFAFVTDDFTTAQQLLQSWDPEAPIDIFLAASIGGALVIAAGPGDPASPEPNFARIAAIYREALQAIPYSASLRIGLSATLINMALTGTSTNRHGDLQEALEHALRARDICRQNRSSSVQAVNLACQAAYCDSQFARVIEIGMAVTGEATSEEANSDVVRVYVASAAIIRGQTSISEELIPHIADAFQRALLVAMSAEVARHASADLWRSALDQAHSTTDRVQALLGLARMGIIDQPSLEGIARDSRQQAVLIRAVAAASSGSVDAAIQELRALESMDFNSTTALVNAYVQAGNVGAAVDVLREASQTLSEPRLRIEAAVLLWQEDQRDEARAQLEELLVDSGSNEDLRLASLAILGQWAADQGQWARAQERFQEFLALKPNDSNARWAVILAMLRQGLISDASRVYNSSPVEQKIIYPDHARAWMAVKTHEVQVDFVKLVEEIIEVAGRFPDNEDVQAEAIFAVLSPSSREEPPLPSPVQARFNDLCDRFFRSWPDSSRLRRYSTNDIADFVSQMEDLVRPTQQEKVLRREIADRLAKNTLPWAFLSVMTGRSYSEVVIVRGAGVLPAQHIDTVEQQLCVEAAQAALNKEVVVDISAASVITELGDLTNLLIGQFERLIVSEGERLDAVRAVEFLRNRSTSTWVYDELNDRGRLADIPAEVADLHYNKAVKLVDIIRRCRVVSVKLDPPLTELKELASSSWASAVQCAAQNSAIFWCDDVALRAVARSIGVAAFSTPSLLQVLFERQVLSAAQRESGIRTLIKAMVGDFLLDQVRLSTLTAEYGNVAAPIASLFSRSAAWANFNASYPIWITLVGQVATFDKRYAADWLNAATVGFTRLLQGADIRREAGALLLGSAATIISNDPDEVARCVVAVRAGLAGTREEECDDDPLGRAAQMIRATLARDIGIPSATTYVSSMFSRLDSTDRYKVLQALYT
jgi:tetratricopeptide (TPR) repeat protein